MAASMEEDLDLIESDDYYAWLGLSKNASKEDISIAFRRMSRLYHPDKHASNEALRDKAQRLFTKINKAHEVLSDPHKRAIYDTMGLKGLETDDWQLIPRNRTPQEILEEYENLQKEKEERRMQQCTNPRGSINIGIDATNVFESYGVLDDDDYGGMMLPEIEISSMSISQSVEMPLTAKDTATLTGSLSSQNGVGSGHLNVSLRRIMSQKGWAEVEVGVGNGANFTVRGFRNLWRRSYATMAGSMQLTPRGIRPHLQTVVVQQLDKNLQGRLIWGAGSPSSMQTVLVWDNNNHHVMAALQFARVNVFFSINYSWKCMEDGKFKAALRFGTMGGMLEYGCEKKITRFSVVGASMIVGIPLGVALKIKFNRGSQTYVFPIQLADSIAPNAIFYGTLLPLVSYFVIKVLVINPFLKRQNEQESKKKKEVNVERRQEKKREAEIAIELMHETVERSVEIESAKNGLVIKKALYGKLQAEDVRDIECINVTRPLQALVKDSKLILPEGTKLCELPGFYDPSVGDDKEISIIYHFRNQLHQCQQSDKDRIRIPHRDHLVEEGDAASEDRNAVGEHGNHSASGSTNS